MMNWIKANPLVAAAGGALLLVVAVAALIMYFGEREAVRHEQQNAQQTIGAQTERLEANEEVLNNVKEANDAVGDNRSSSDVERMRERFDRARRSDGQ